MAFTYRLVQARTAYSVVAVNTNVTLVAGDSVVAVLIKVTGASARTGGAPTLAGVAMTQASSAQFAAASPEAGAELWYTLNPNAAGSTALTIPDSNAVAGFYTVVSGQASTGVAGLTNAAGANGTSTNPAPGSITPTAAGDIGFAIVASGSYHMEPVTSGGYGHCQHGRRGAWRRRAVRYRSEHDGDKPRMDLRHVGRLGGRGCVLQGSPAAPHTGQKT
jgi:hypothetical protein